MLAVVLGCRGSEVAEGGGRGVVAAPALSSSDLKVSLLSPLFFCFLPHPDPVADVLGVLAPVVVGCWWCEIRTGRNPWPAGLTTAVATLSGAALPLEAPLRS